MNNKAMVIVSIILGAVFFVIGIVYFTHTAGMLPGFFPGHEAGSATVHVKHGIAALVVGIACFIYAWFASAPKKNA